MVKSMKRVTKSPPPIGGVDFVDFGPGSKKSRNWCFGLSGLPPSGFLRSARNLASSLLTRTSAE